MVTWIKDFFNGLFSPSEEVGLLGYITDEELEELFAATEEEEWEDPEWDPTEMTEEVYEL